MTISVWRYSHLALAVSSFLLLTLASVTGIILAFEPLTQKVQAYRTDGFNEITLSEALPVIKKQYPGVSELTVDANQFVQLKGSDAQGKNMLAYIDPRTGKILGHPGPKNEFFQWVTSLHRSLFLHETGRFFIGLTAFLLLLIAISGTLLILQRQRSLKRFFGKIARDGFAQYYHVVLGRLSLIPIIIIALTGTYLSLNKFGIIADPKITSKVDFDAIREKPERKLTDIAIFKNTKLAQVQSIEFPFSEDVEDYYTLKLTDRELTVNQVTGDILSEVKYPTTLLLTNLSLNLHTGRTNAIWAVILAIASANILFFIYSGFVITWKRISNRTKNKYTANEARFVMLVGSENGSTFGFAQAIHRQLLKQGEKSFISQLNDYTLYPKADHLIICTSTYGLGDAPANARKFPSLLAKYVQQQKITYSTIGFGSHAYPDFCKFAFEVNALMAQQPWAVALTDIHTVNDKSREEFRLWAEAWSSRSGVVIDALAEMQSAKPMRLETLTVAHTTAANSVEGTFGLSLQSQKKLKVTSGDLLAVYPQNDYRERLYSIGLIENQIRLSVRLHPNGLGSGFLHGLKPGDTLKARIVNNNHFHFPQKATQVIMVSNGTGIAPYLGMISQNESTVPCHLYCGFRTSASFSNYQEFLDQHQAVQKLAGYQVALSREGNRQYISTLIARDANFVAQVLKDGGVMMLCGSLSMQKDVLTLLETICMHKTGKELSYYQSHGQILMDCY
ncbi:hypothetical protein GCM10027037_05070 [Mucilaginibacter koreensis]